LGHTLVLLGSKIINGLKASLENGNAIEGVYGEGKKLTSAPSLVAGDAMKLGVFVYRLYRALTYGVSPLIHLHIRWRRLRGLEHFSRWPERFGHPSAVRPPGSLIWFHAVSWILIYLAPKARNIFCLAPDIRKMSLSIYFNSDKW